ncbi:hypothetical protein ACHBTE_15545 [Streptomyces sp. M41]
MASHDAWPTDHYPPFRLDMGGQESPPTDSPPTDIPQRPVP